MSVKAGVFREDVTEAMHRCQTARDSREQRGDICSNLMALRPCLEDPVCERIDQAVHCQRLPRVPRLLHNRAGADVEDLCAGVCVGGAGCGWTGEGGRHAVMQVEHH
jgi:hypothetical protein